MRENSEYAKSPYILMVFPFGVLAPDGRASGHQWHLRGQRFYPAYLHHRSLENHWFSRLFSLCGTFGFASRNNFDPYLTANLRCPKSLSCFTPLSETEGHGKLPRPDPPANAHQWETPERTFGWPPVGSPPGRGDSAESSAAGHRTMRSATAASPSPQRKQRNFSQP